MENKTATGTNRTGIDMSPVDIKEMLALTSVTPPSSPGDQKAIAEMRGRYIAEGDAVGSVPMPGTFKGVASTFMQTVTGKARPDLSTSSAAGSHSSARAFGFTMHSSPRFLRRQ
jgi:hypothetical protein